MLERATALVGLPVVSITEGDALADIKDVIYAPEEGRLLGFTLNSRRRLGGPVKEPLPTSAVYAIGRDAVMVDDHAALGASDLRGTRKDSAGRNVLGDEVLTDVGSRIGRISDLIVVLGVVTDPDAAAVPGTVTPPGDRPGDVVGYELAPEPDAEGGEARTRYLPLPDTLAVSGEYLMVPARAAVFVQDDMATFAAALASYRQEEQAAVPPAVPQAPEAQEPATQSAAPPPLPRPTAPDVPAAPEVAPEAAAATTAPATPPVPPVPPTAASVTTVTTATTPTSPPPAGPAPASGVRDAEATSADPQ
jgi:sporulation protein YlmC with PRC-barrel domain